jgi:hypothetical protein
MASTYSTNLALELIGTGDQAGTWGNTTNTNLGTLIEQAISGYVTQAITDGADTTITIPNGSTGVARNMYIECTGTLTADRNLVVPANKKLYFIYNNTTGGFSVTVKVSGQTGVSVPNGAKRILVSNGTDIVEAITDKLIGVTDSTSLALTALGYDAGVSVGSGENNTTIGYKAGTAITGSAGGNTCVGSYAGLAITSGSQNTSIGWNAGPYTFNQGFNTCVGAYAGTSINSSENTFIGRFAGQSTLTGSTGSGNTALGDSALRGLSGGALNTVLGAAAGQSITSGSDNVLVGVSAGYYSSAITTGSGNVIVGTQASSGSASAASRIVLGFQVVGTGNNRITIGSTTNIAELDLDGSDTSWAASSDERLKENIQTSNIGLSLITNLRPVSYQWRKGKDVPEDVPGHVPEFDEEGDFNPDSEKRVHGDGDSVYLGFVAQEANAAITAHNAEILRMVKQRDDGVYTVAPSALIPALVKAIQELKAEFDEYKANHP